MNTGLRWLFPTHVLLHRINAGGAALKSGSNPLPFWATEFTTNNTFRGAHYIRNS